jgi:hypothetical protein
MSRLVTVIVAAVALSACAKFGPKPTSSKVAPAAKTNAPMLRSSKLLPIKSSTAPAALPPERTAGETHVKVPDPTSGGTVEVDTWTFSNIDLDGSGIGDHGAIMADDTTLVALFDGNYDDGSYHAAVFSTAAGVGFSFDFGSKGSFACSESATATTGCVSCDASGMCVAGGTDGNSMPNQ